MATVLPAMAMSFGTMSDLKKMDTFLSLMQGLLVFAGLC